MKSFIRFECDLCGRRLGEAQRLLSHQLIHTGERKHRCDICRRAYAGRGELVRHRRLVHRLRPVPRFECENCGHRAASEIAWKRHCKKHGGVARVALHCPLCRKLFFGKANLDNHVRGVHYREGRDECELCGRRLFNLKLHALVHDGVRRFRCATCGARFVRQTDLRTHERRMHERLTPFACPRCGKAFCTSGELVSHQRVHEKLKRQSVARFECDVCGRCSINETALRVHQLIHTGERKHRCDMCRWAFSTGGKLNRHRRAVHRLDIGGRPARRFECENCGRQTATQHLLMTHRATHAAAERELFRCQLCERRYLQKAVLAQHIKAVHERQQRNNECQLCGRCLCNKNTLMNHTALHDGIRRFFHCTKCTARFTERGNLRRHVIQVHEHRKPFACERCGQGLYHLSQVALHQRIHEGLTKGRGKYDAGIHGV